jgi:heme-degrading monooxygenase HmoA
LISFPPAVDARKQAMISRQWVGVTRPDAAAQYVTHLKTETFPKLEQIPGFHRAAIYRREVSDGVEFRIVTTWESMAAIRQFAGERPEEAVVPEVARAMMVRFDGTVAHYDIVE